MAVSYEQLEAKMCCKSWISYIGNCIQPVAVVCSYHPGWPASFLHPDAARGGELERKAGGGGGLETPLSFVKCSAEVRRSSAVGTKPNSSLLLLASAPCSWWRGKPSSAAEELRFSRCYRAGDRPRLPQHSSTCAAYLRPAITERGEAIWV